MNQCSQCKDLKNAVLKLKEKIAVLEKKIQFFETHPTILRGIKGEALICNLTKGIITNYSEKFDILTEGNIRIEVKYSRLCKPNLSSGDTLRWSWSKPLGFLDKGKEYDFLLLIGDKDIRYLSQYIDESPYVFFLIPRIKVNEIMTSGKSIGGNVNLTTNFCSIRSKVSKEILNHIISMDLIEILEKNVRT